MIDRIPSSRCKLLAEDPAALNVTVPSRMGGQNCAHCPALSPSPHVESSKAET
jgi:hypothetical protein